VNANQELTHGGRALAKTVNTGWSESPAGGSTRSNVLTLWGLADNLVLHDPDLKGSLPDRNESRVADTYALALSFDARGLDTSLLKRGRLVLASRDAAGDWVPAVKNNAGGASTFNYGPWRADYTLGAYGVDPSSNQVWAVVNHEGEFAAMLI
jgi:hypothetical protein